MNSRVSSPGRRTSSCSVRHTRLSRCSSECVTSPATSFMRQHVHVRRLAALRAVAAVDDGPAVEAARRLARGRRQLLPRLEHAPLAVHAPAEALRGLGAQPRRVVLEVVVERRGALHAVADAAALALAGRRLGHLDAGAVESRAGEHVADVAGEPGVVIGDDVRVELALDFVDDAGRPPQGGQFTCPQATQARSMCRSLPWSLSR